MAIDIDISLSDVIGSAFFGKSDIDIINAWVDAGYNPHLIYDMGWTIFFDPGGLDEQIMGIYGEKLNRELLISAGLSLLYADKREWIDG